MTSSPGSRTSQWLAAARLDFPIITKPVVHKLNFRHLREMIYFVTWVGGTAINPQAVEKGTSEVDGELWIGPDKVNEFGGCATGCSR